MDDVLLKPEDEKKIRQFLEWKKGGKKEFKSNIEILKRKGIVKMKTIDEVKQELDKLQFQLRSMEDDTHNFTFNEDDPDQELLRKKINKCLEDVFDLNQSIKQLSAGILVEGELYRNQNGRFEVNTFELTSGMSLEYWSQEEWKEDRMEFFSGDYGLYDVKRHNLEGLYVRIRKIR